MPTLAVAALIALVFVAVASSPVPARADAGPKITSGWYLPFGFALGLSIHGPNVSNGFFLGGEVSYVYLDVERGFWIGGYVDSLYDFGAEVGRFSVGPEIGYGVFGVDFGYLAQFGDGYRHGTSVRVVLTMAIAAIYGRWGHVFGDVAEHDFGELGFLIKVPIPIDVEPVRRPRPGPQPPVQPQTQQEPQAAPVPVTPPQ